MKASWNGHVIAESYQTVEVDGYHYFPASSVRPGLLEKTKTTSRCGYKGTARYYTLTAGGKTNEDCAWSYDEPLEGAGRIAGMIAFWGGVKIKR